MVISIIVILLALTATSAAAGREMPTVGDQVYIFNGGDIVINAGVPFHIRHGYLAKSIDADAIGVFDFNLEISGIQLKPGLRYTSPETGLVQRIYNFPQGLPEGTYSYIGRWYAPCQYILGLAECPDPNKPVLDIIQTGKIIINP